MKSSEIRQKYLDFFTDKVRKHKIIPPAPLVPENDPTTLFTSSGMQQLVPYLKGEPHPLGKRLCDSQPSLRLQDIEEVGDTSHTTFFEMLGNWSLGDYFKKEQLSWFFEFLTSPKLLKLAPEKLFVSVFEGTKDVPRDEESFKIWQSLGIPKQRIYFYGPDKNWWSRSGIPENMPPGEIGGPDSEVFYDFGADLNLHENSPYKNERCHPNCQCGRFLEIGNSVFIEYEKQPDGRLIELPQKNVDFGGGLERLTAATNNDPDIFKIDLFTLLIRFIEATSEKKYQGNEKSMRIITDHLRAATFLIKEGLEPNNKQQGYILRRLIRRSTVKMMQLDIVPGKLIPQITQAIGDTYGEAYFTDKDLINIHVAIGGEIHEFQQTIHKGTKLLQTEPEINGKLVFDLYQSYGFPLEITLELLSQWGRLDNKQKLQEEFNQEFAKHQELSRTASAGMFKGGLADHSEIVTKYHTATHLLHAALRQILGEHVQQKGSNITAERLRFDFSHPQKLTAEQVENVEQVVNEKIKENLSIKMEIMDLKDAQKSGALGFFESKYGDKVKVYSIGSFSVEICGGPHVDFTGKLRSFKIIKEEAAGSGVRRIYGVLNSD